MHIASTTFLRLMHVMKSVQTRNEIGTCMYRAKRKAPAILTEPFNKTNGAFCQEKSLCLISYTSLNSSLKHFTEIGCPAVLAADNALIMN